jgi:hypothetical protein
VSFPKTKRPRDVKVLDRWIRDLAENGDTAANRTRRSLSYVVVAAALAQLREDDGTPLFVLKGGVAMQLRFGSRARLSNDYDAAFRRKIVEHLEAVLAQAPACPVGEFRVRAIGKPEPLGPTGAFRQTLKLTYAGKPWGEVRLEVSEPEGASVDLGTLEYLPATPDPTMFGLDEIGTVPVMSVAYQIAQKLHACTEIREDKENQRFTDLLDLQLLAELVADDEWKQVRGACVETFALRGKHSWPPVITVFQGWAEGYERTALENGFQVTDIKSAVAAVEAIVQRIDPSG